MEQQLAASNQQREQQVASIEQQLAASIQQIEQQREELAASNQQREQQVASIEQQLAASIQQIEQQREENNQQREQQREELAASNQLREQQVASMEQQLAARQQQLEKNSIHALLNSERTGNNNEGLFTLKCQGNDTSHTTSNSHLPASTNPIDFKLEPVALTEDMKCQTSMLMTKLDSCRGAIPYQSEADISMYINHALDDAIKIISLTKKIHLNVRHEQSIFSQRPDHVVVYDVESNLPIIAVEDKKPASKGILTRNTAGQVFDYAVSMQSCGHKAPFVVLSSVDETYVTWLDESLPRALAAGHGRIEAVSMNGSSPSVERSANAVDQVDETPSPPNLIDGDSCPPQAQVLVKSQAPSGSQQLMFEANAERKFCRSTNVYNSSQLTRVLYSAILCGLQGVDRSSAKSITRFTPPSACDAKHCLELSEDSYDWGTISSNRKRPTRLKASPKKKYYVVGVIGSGNTSKVFHAVDLDCKEYAIKMYVKRFDGNTCFTKEEFEENGRKSVNTEVENFKLIYPKLNVVCQKLNNHHCVIMPFFILSQRMNVRTTLRKLKMFSKCLHRRSANIRMKTSVGGMWDFTQENAFSMILQNSRHRRREEI
jgi:hypothetical protein